MENLSTLLNIEYDALVHRSITYNPSEILLVSLKDKTFEDAKQIEDPKKLDRLARENFGRGYKKIKQVAGNLWHIDFTKTSMGRSNHLHGYGLRVGIPANYPEVIIQRNLHTNSPRNLNDDQRTI